jgi:ornithine cyclodeaminase/alanine dehydrogenase-like protein (mu-crystallin family)
MEENKDVAPVKPEVKQYEFAHLVVHCGKCNSKYVLDKDVTGGVHITLPTASTSELVLVCKECKNSMALYFVESDGASKKQESKVESAEIEEVTPEIAYEPKMEVVE